MSIEIAEAPNGYQQLYLARHPDLASLENGRLLAALQEMPHSVIYDVLSMAMFPNEAAAAIDALADNYRDEASELYVAGKLDPEWQRLCAFSEAMRRLAAECRNLSDSLTVH